MKRKKKEHANSACFSQLFSSASLFSCRYSSLPSIIWRSLSTYYLDNVIERWDREKGIRKIYDDQLWTEANEDNMRILRKQMQLLTLSWSTSLQLYISQSFYKLSNYDKVKGTLKWASKTVTLYPIRQEVCSIQ